MKTLQYFDKDYLEHCRTLSLEQRLQFLEDFRKLHEPSQGSQLISLKVPKHLLKLFKKKATAHQLKYQSQIKKLMEDWVRQTIK
jgi:predicted DNA binding CopG/RHH family protein